MENAIVSEEGYVVPFAKLASVGPVKEYSTTRDNKSITFWKFFFNDVGGSTHQTVRIFEKEVADVAREQAVRGMMK